MKKLHLFNLGMLFILFMITLPGCTNEKDETVSYSKLVIAAQDTLVQSSYDFTINLANYRYDLFMAHPEKKAIYDAFIDGQIYLPICEMNTENLQDEDILRLVSHECQASIKRKFVREKYPEIFKDREKLVSMLEIMNKQRIKSIKLPSKFRQDD